MTTTAIPGQTVRSRGKTSERLKRLRWWAKSVGIPKARYRAAQYLDYGKTNFQTVAALSSFTAAGFVHSVFSGLIVMGVCWGALEVKTKGT